MEKYVEIALALSARGRAINIREMAVQQKYAQDHNLELYRSYYFFDETLLDHLKVYKTIKGFNGSPFIDLIILDIDKGKDTDARTHYRAIALLHKLKEMEIADINIRVYYSGTGYHFVVPNLWNFHTQLELKETLISIFPECDPAIYSHSSLIRVANTINFKSQRYKVGLTHSQLLTNSTEDILFYAGSPQMIIYEPFEESHQLEKFKLTPKFVITEQPEIVLDEELTPIVTCAQKMYNSKPEKGTRHNTMFRMISAFKRNGVPVSGIEDMMMKWALNEMEKGEIRKLVTDHYKKNYPYGCHDVVMSKFCDERCMFFKKKSYNASTPKDVHVLEAQLKTMAGGQDKPYIELATHFGLHESFGIYPEEFVVITGDTGLGKSSLAQNIIVKEKRMKVLYLNFEVGERLMYRRELQIEHGMTKFEIIQHYANPEAPTLSKGVEHIHMISDRINMHTLENIIMTGEYQVVIADTLECFITPGITEITPKTEFIAHEMKRLAKRYQLIIIAIHHISKSAVQDPSGNVKRLTVHSGKGSSAIEQEADKVLLLEGNPNNLIRLLRSAKARDEPPFEVKLRFDAERTFRFYQEKEWKETEVNWDESSTASSPLESVKEFLSQSLVRAVVL